MNTHARSHSEAINNSEALDTYLEEKINSVLLDALVDTPVSSVSTRETPLFHPCTPPVDPKQVL